MLFSWFVVLQLIQIISWNDNLSLNFFFSIFQFYILQFYKIFFPLKDRLFSIFLSIFSFLWPGFLKNLWKQKILYLSYISSNFKQFCHSNFRSYIFTNTFRKIYENKNIVFKWFFRVISNYFCTWVSPSYIFTKMFWKIYGNKNIVFCSLKIFWKIYEN